MFFIKKIRTPHNGRACTRTGARESWSGLATVDRGARRWPATARSCSRRWRACRMNSDRTRRPKISSVSPAHSMHRARLCTCLKFLLVHAMRADTGTRLFCGRRVLAQNGPAAELTARAGARRTIHRHLRQEINRDDQPEGQLAVSTLACTGWACIYSVLCLVYLFSWPIL